MDSVSYVYFISDNKKCIKIGKADYVEVRMKQLQTGCSSKLCLLYKIKTLKQDVNAIEHVLHKMFKPYRTIGEWFEKDEVIKYIDSYLKLFNSDHVFAKQDFLNESNQINKINKKSIKTDIIAVEDIRKFTPFKHFWINLYDGNRNQVDNVNVLYHFNDGIIIRYFDEYTHMYMDLALRYENYNKCIDVLNKSVEICWHAFYKEPKKLISTNEMHLLNIHRVGFKKFKCIDCEEEWITTNENNKEYDIHVCPRCNSKNIYK